MSALYQTFPGFAFPLWFDYHQFMDLPQLLLLFVIFAVSVLLVVVGIQLFLLLKETRDSLRRVDHLLTDLEFLSRSFSSASSSLTHLSAGLQSGMQLVGLLSSLLTRKTKKS